MNELGILILAIILKIMAFPIALGIALIVGAVFFRIRDGHW